MSEYPSPARTIAIWIYVVSSVKVEKNRQHESTYDAKICSSKVTTFAVQNKLY